MGDKLVPVTWEEHFQALRDAVTEALKGEHGYPVAVRLLGLVQEMAALLPPLMQDENTKGDFLSSEPGVYSTFIIRPQLPWDWETMRPAGFMQEPIFKAENPRQVSRQEAASFAALSKGLAWLVEDGVKTPALFHGLNGLTSFPKEDPPPIPLGMKVEGGIFDFALVMDLAKGLNFPLDGTTVGDFVGYLTIVPGTFGVGGGAGYFTPRDGFPFDQDLSALLGIGDEAWSDLKLRGETRGRPWENRFSVVCRGLEVNRDSGVAQFVLELAPSWGEGKPWGAPGPDQLKAALEEPAEMKEAAMAWDGADWIDWGESLFRTLGRTMDRLRGRRDAFRGTGGTVAGGAAGVMASFGGSGEGHVLQPPASADMKLKGLQPSLKVETIQREASWVSGEGRISHLAETQIRILGQPAPDYTKARQLRRVEEERLKEGESIVASGADAPDWLVSSRGRTGGYALAKKELLRIRESLLEERFGFIEPDPGGSPRWVKGFRLENGETRELRIGGQGLLFLNRRNRASWRDTWRREESALAMQEKNLLDEMSLALFKPEEELDHTRKELEKVRKRQEALTSWGMAMDLLKHLVEEQAVQGRNPIEVDAVACRDWLWAGKEAPDNWLQTVVETLSLLFNCSAAVTSGEKELAGGSFITVNTRRKDAPTRELKPEEAKGVKGSNLVYIVQINPALLGGAALLKTGTRTLTSGVEAVTFETRKLTKAQDKAVKEQGDRFGFREAHLAVLLKALGFTDEEITLAEFLTSHLTLARSSMAGKWTTKPKTGKHEDGTRHRRYTPVFCPLIPEDHFLHGALGNFKQVNAAEKGWDMAGRPTLARHRGGLLHQMGLDLPAGAADSARRAVFLKGLRALRRVVVELGDGVLALKAPDGVWYDLGKDLEEPVALHLLQAGKVFPFFAHGWREKVRSAYEAKTGVKLTGSIAEADRIRWETRPATPENTLDGLPLHVQLNAALERRGLTQAQAAEELGVSAMMVSLWIRGRKPLSAESSAKVRAWIATGGA